MQAVSALYRSILAQPDHYKEIRVQIGNTSPAVISCSVSGGIFSAASVGNTESRQLDLDILPTETVPANTPVFLFVRLSSADDSQKSEWLPKGTFYIDTSPTDYETGVMSIHAFDAMLKMEQPMIPLDAPSGTWPKSPREVMEEIAYRIGVTLDPRTVLNPAYSVPYPVSTSPRARAEGESLILNTDTKIIHYRTCSHVSSIAPENRQSSTASIADLEADGYSPCKACRPADSSGGSSGDSDPLSMRTVAGYVAAMHGGNWTITDTNTLLLVPLASDIAVLSTQDAAAVLFGDMILLVDE